jgi:hypothetical protein
MSRSYWIYYLMLSYKIYGLQYVGRPKWKMRNDLTFQ